MKERREKFEKLAREGGDKATEQRNEKECNEEISRLNQKVKILEGRATRFEKKAIENYEKLMKQINNDPRFAALKEEEGRGGMRDY